MNFTSKYLSPCRTVGLKRKSKSPNCLTSKKLNSVDNAHHQEIDLSLINNDYMKNELSLSNVDASQLPSNLFLPSSNEDLQHPSENISESRLILQPVTPKPDLKRLNLPNAVVYNTPKSSKYIQRDLNRTHEKMPEVGDLNSGIPNTSSPVIKKEDLRELSKVVCTPKELSRSLFLKKCQGKEKMLKLQENHTGFNNENNRSEQDIPHCIKEIVLRIDKKINKLHHLKNNQLYSKKHDVQKLNELSENWKRVCIEVLERLHSEMSSRGVTNMSLLGLIKTHSIPPELLSFNEETEEFT